MEMPGAGYDPEETIANLCAECERLHAIVDRLLVDAVGKLILYKMPYLIDDRDGRVYRADYMEDDDGPIWFIDISEGGGAVEYVLSGRPDSVYVDRADAERAWGEA
jgi:hypothetical protein